MLAWQHACPLFPLAHTAISPAVHPGPLFALSTAAPGVCAGQPKASIPNVPNSDFLFGVVRVEAQLAALLRHPRSYVCRVGMCRTARK